MDSKQETRHDPQRFHQENGRASFRVDGFPFEEAPISWASLSESLHDELTGVAEPDSRGQDSEARQATPIDIWRRRVGEYSRTAWHAFKLWSMLIAVSAWRWLSRVARGSWHVLRLLVLDGVAGIRWVSSNVTNWSRSVNEYFRTQRSQRSIAKVAPLRSQRAEAGPLSNSAPRRPPSLPELAREAFEFRQAQEALTQAEQRHRREAADAAALERLMARRLGLRIHSEAGRAEVDGVRFAARWLETARAYELVVLSTCPVCQSNVMSGDILDLADLGEVLADLQESQQLCEACRESAEAPGPTLDVSVRESPSQRLPSTEHDRNDDQQARSDLHAAEPATTGTHASQP